MSVGGPRVLIVDDDVAILKVLSSQLAQAGILSSQANSGERALAVLDTQAVDVVLTDLRMPGMDGMALLSHIARGWPEVPVIVLTAHGSIQLAVESMKNGAADFIVKPFDHNVLIDTLERVLV